jgi:hypothetical protein
MLGTGKPFQPSSLKFVNKSGAYPSEGSKIRSTLGQALYPRTGAYLEMEFLISTLGT